MSAAGVSLSVDRIGTRPFERRQGEVLLACDIRSRALIDMSRGAGPGAGRPGCGLARQPSCPLPSPRCSAGSGGFGTTRRQPRGLPLPRLRRLRPADIADIVEQASHEEGE